MATRAVPYLFVAQHIREELKQDIREDYREKVLQLFGELQAIGDASPSQDKQKQQIVTEGITTNTSPQTSSDPIDKIIDFAKKLPTPEQPKVTKPLDQNDVTGSSGLGKPPSHKLVTTLAEEMRKLV